MISIREKSKSESIPTAPEGLELFIFFEFALSVFDRDMMNDHRNGNLKQEVGKASGRKIGAFVARMG